MQHVRAGVIAHSCAPSLGVDLRAELLPHRHASVQPAPMDDEARHGLLRVGDREQHRAVGAGARPDRRPGRRPRRRTASDRARFPPPRRPAPASPPRRSPPAPGNRFRRAGSPPRGRGRSWSRNRGTSSRRRVPRPGRRGPVRRRARTARPSCRRGSFGAVLQSGLEALAVHAHAVLGRQLYGQVDRKPYVSCRRKATSPGSTANRPAVLRAYGDPSLGRGERDERLLELDDAGIERARELALLCGDHAGNLCSALAQERVGTLHCGNHTPDRSARNGSCRPSSRPWRTARRRMRR